MHQEHSNTGFYVTARGCKGSIALMGPFPTYEEAREALPEAASLAQANPEIWEYLLVAMAECGGLHFGVTELQGVRS